MSEPNAGNPGYSDHAPPPLLPYTSPRQRLRFARICVIIVMIASGASAVLSVVTGVLSSQAITADPSGAASDLTALEVSQELVDRIVQVGALDLAAAAILLIGLLLAGIGVIRWQSQALVNFGNLAVPPPRLSPTAAGFAWFVPIWNFFGPKLVFDDLWRSGDVRTPAYPSPQAFAALPVPGFLAVWWFCWIVGNLFGNIAGRVPVGTLGGLLANSVVNIVVQAILIAAGLLFLRVMTMISARQDERRVLLIGPSSGLYSA